MKNQDLPNRPSLWEEDAPAESRFRRVRQGLPGSERVQPGMPLEFDDADEDDQARSSRPRFRYDEPRGPWWRPASKAGRVFLSILALATLASLTAAGLALKTYLERDARFRIAGSANIQAAGLTEVSRAQMLPVFGEDIGRNIFFVPIDARRKQLEAIPWVERATVMRLLPDQIRVSIVERQPVAFTRIGNQIGLVDANGVLLNMTAAAMARHHYSFPVLTGIDPRDPAYARQTRMAVYLRLMSELDSTGQHYSRQISEIDLTDPQDARVLMPERGTDILAHFGEDHFLERYQRYQAHIAEWREDYPQLAAVDLRYDRQVVLQMASGRQSADAMEPQKQEAGQATAKTDSPLGQGAKKTPSGAKTSHGSAAARKRALLEHKPAAAHRASLYSRPADKTRQPASRSARTAAPPAQGG